MTVDINFIPPPLSPPPPKITLSAYSYGLSLTFRGFRDFIIYLLEIIFLTFKDSVSVISALLKTFKVLNF